jgi:HD-GYP domain-containing protein (c-di-GMP phosphodiesterase class II)
MIILTDRTDLPDLPSSILGFFVEIVSLSDGLPRQPRMLVIDIDLGSMDAMAKLSAQLKTLSRDTIKVFAIDAKSRRQELQANALGASMTIARPLNELSLARILEKQVRGDDRPPSSQSAVKNAAQALATAFEMITQNAEVDLDQISQSGAEIADTVGTLGVEDWLTTVRIYHQSTFQHILLVTGIVVGFAQTTGMSNQDTFKLATAGLLHDIGKVNIPADILNKPGQLSPEEFEIVRTHPVIGHQMLKAQPGVSPDILHAVRHHHEFLDGTGYPDGLAGKEIPDLTRILTVCDIMGALLERRTYKEPYSLKRAFEILLGLADAGKVEKALVMALARSVDTAKPTVSHPAIVARASLIPLYIT